MSTASKIEVFSYMDYRAFLRDYYLDRKATRGLSYRGFSKRARLKSPNYLKLVIEGKRNLTPEMAGRFAEACRLDGEASAFFCSLVAFNQASNAADRNKYYTELTGFREYRKAHKLELAHAAYHSTWYLPAIRELVARADFNHDPSWIARSLVPPITKIEAIRAIETLVELGLLIRDEDGTLTQSEAIVSTGPETRGLHIANYHRMMMDRAGRALDELPRSDRDISSLTLGVGEDGLRRLKERIQRFRRELLELAAVDEAPQQVVQVNFQVFPLSDVAGRRSKKPPRGG